MNYLDNIFQYIISLILPMDLPKDLIIQISLYLNPKDLQSFIDTYVFNFTLIDYVYLLSTKYPQYYHRNISKYNASYLYVGLLNYNEKYNHLQIIKTDQNNEKSITLMISLQIYSVLNIEYHKSIFHELIKYLLIEFLINKEEDIIPTLKQCEYIKFTIVFNEYKSSLTPKDIIDIYFYKLNHYYDDDEDAKIITLLAHHPVIESKYLS